MTALTNADLSRLMALKCVHGGTLQNIPNGVGSSLEALALARLVTIENFEAADDDKTLPIRVVGAPDGELEYGSALLCCGPISLEVNACELRRALLPFVKRKR